MGVACGDLKCVLLAEMGVRHGDVSVVVVVGWNKVVKVTR